MNRLELSCAIFKVTLFLLKGCSMCEDASVQSFYEIISVMVAVTLICFLNLDAHIHYKCQVTLLLNMSTDYYQLN